MASQAKRDVSRLHLYAARPETLENRLRVIIMSYDAGKAYEAMRLERDRLRAENLRLRTAIAEIADDLESETIGPIGGAVFLRDLLEPDLSPVPETS